MNDGGMTPEEEHEFYGRPENQVPRDRGGAASSE